MSVLQLSQNVLIPACLLLLILPQRKLAIATRKGAERVIAIDAYRNRHHPALSLELSKTLPAVRAA